MKRLYAMRVFFFGCFLYGIFGAVGANAAFISWTNTAGGNWFDPVNWSPNVVPGALDAAFITNNGTYTVLAPTGTVATAVFAIGGGSGKQTLLYGTTASFQFNISNSVVRSTGRLVVTNAGLTGNLLVQPGGELDLNSQGTLFLYNFALTNQGTLTWSNGLLETGGTFITNPRALSGRLRAIIAP